MFWHEGPNRVRRLREGVESRPQGLPGDRPQSHLGHPRRPRLQGGVGSGERGAQAGDDLAGERHQLPRGDEGDRRSEGRGEDGEGRTPLDLQPRHGRVRVQAAHRQDHPEEPPEGLPRGDRRSRQEDILAPFRPQASS